MTVLLTTHRMRGGCHCGDVALVFATSREFASFSPRACDCSFCRMHGAAYVSDPLGHLSLSLADGATLREYRQGSNSADFLLCGRCGVLVAVVFAHAARLFGAVNANCLDESHHLGEEMPASPQVLAPDEKVARWLALWTPDVDLPTLRS